MTVKNDNRCILIRTDMYPSFRRINRICEGGQILSQGLLCLFTLCFHLSAIPISAAETAEANVTAVSKENVPLVILARGRRIIV